MGYLSEESLNKLVTDPGKYALEDYSTIAHQLNIWWSYCATLVPDWISANVVTVGAAAPLIISWLLSCIYSLNPENEGLPWWLLIFAAFGEFFFQTMDAVDGKHARRLGTSSSLGDFLDHVMDSVSIMTSAFIFSRALGFKSIPFEYFCFLDCSLSFVVVHWESAKILIMKLDNGSSITEGQLAFMLFYILSAFVSIDFWQIAPIHFLPFISIGKIIALCMMFGITVAQCYKSISRVLEQKDWRVVLPELFVPVICGLCVATLWVLILPENHCIVPFQFVILSSTVIHSCCITLNRLTLQPILLTTTLPSFIPALVLPLIVPASFRMIAAWIAGFWALGYMLYFLIDIVLAISRTLNVPIFAQPELKKKD